MTIRKLGIGLAVSTLLLCGALVVLFQECIFSRIVSQHTSPDGKVAVKINKRTAFPPNDFVDPATVVGIELRELKTGRVIDSKRIELVKDSDLREVAVLWKLDSVCVWGVGNIIELNR